MRREAFKHHILCAGQLKEALYVDYPKKRGIRLWALDRITSTSRWAIREKGRRKKAACAASVGIDGSFSGIDATEIDPVFIQQMHTYQAKDKAAPALINPAVIIVEIIILRFKL
ncbi:hypothetical protein A8L50_22900 [Pantoea ananatis]|nr:hypothetical protein [Pantoea ananatis]NQE82162.1 hypothetical protein [Pantoea ananatis]